MPGRIKNLQKFKEFAVRLRRIFLNLAEHAQHGSRAIWRSKDFWVRVVLCWTVGAVLIGNDELSNYDTRLNVRGHRPSASKIVIVDLAESDWAKMDQDRPNTLRPLKEVVSFADAHFWQPLAWENMLTRILAADPKSVGITFFFGDNIHIPQLTRSARAVFEDYRVVWGADLDHAGRMLSPAFALTYNSNVGLRSLRLDDDGNVRRFSTPAQVSRISSSQVPLLAVRLATVAEPNLKLWNSLASPRFAGSQGLLINYVGGAKSFQVVSGKDVIEGLIPAETFRDRVVLIGSLENPLEQMQTPLGRMSRTEILANITDNVLGNRTIHRWPNLVYLCLMTLFMTGSIWVMLNYPQSVALVVFFLAAILWSAASAWAFDTAHIWLPVFSPLVQLTTTCIVFLSYQLSQNERRTWRLQQEQRYSYEIEQLKSNFVSMMSHDLKTPIAKIQAICDRLISSYTSEELQQDLKTLRRSSDELHRYIQSILKVSKVEAKEFRIQKEVMDINEVIEGVVATLQPLAREKALLIQTNLEPMFSIEADTTLIQEVIQNLVENAIKYGLKSTDGGAAGLIVVRSEEKDDNVVVVVEDTGPGIDPEDQKEIWQKFTRGKQMMTGATPERGTGLGLYLVKYFIELHGGQVFLESELGKGTRIGFSIPIHDESERTES